MPLPTLLWGLASSLIQIFTPLAKDKISKEIARHTDDPAIADQVANSVIDAAKQATGIADPIEAVAAAKHDPQAMASIDKMAEWDKQAWAAEESSRDAASRRAAADPNDQDVFLTRSIVAIVIGLLLSMVVLLIVMVSLKASDGTIGTVLGLLSMAVGVAFGEFKTRYQHRYGTSRSSGAKDAVIGELSRRPRGGD
jgi:hypothetical protein